MKDPKTTVDVNILGSFQYAQYLLACVDWEFFNSYDDVSDDMKEIVEEIREFLDESPPLPMKDNK